MQTQPPNDSSHFVETDTDELITEVGFSLAEQEEMEYEIFQKETTSRGASLEVSDPHLYNYIKDYLAKQGLNDLSGDIDTLIIKNDGTGTTSTTEDNGEQDPVVDNTDTNSNKEPITPPHINKTRLKFTEIVQENLSSNLYYRDKTDKMQVYLHHTVSSGNPLNAINWWRQQSARVATFAVIAGKKKNLNSKYHDGEIYQAFSSQYWAHHLGIKKKYLLADGKSNLYLNKHSVGIEISNWGWLKQKDDGSFVTYYNQLVPDDEVIEYATPYKGYKYYQKYTDYQLESLRKLLVYLCESYGIDKSFKDGLFDIHQGALKGESGIFTHTSVRPDKFDCHPQPELIDILKSL